MPWLLAMLLREERSAAAARAIRSARSALRTCNCSTSPAALPTIPHLHGLRVVLKRRVGRPDAQQVHHAERQVDADVAVVRVAARQQARHRAGHVVPGGPQLFGVLRRPVQERGQLLERLDQRVLGRLGRADLLAEPRQLCRVRGPPGGLIRASVHPSRCSPLSLYNIMRAGLTPCGLQAGPECVIRSVVVVLDRPRQLLLLSVLCGLYVVVYSRVLF